MAQRILGMGDVMTLIEKAEASYDEDQAAELARLDAAGDGAGLARALKPPVAALAHHPHGRQRRGAGAGVGRRDAALEPARL